MPRILFKGGDKDGKYDDLLMLPEDSIMIFDGYGGIGSPRGKYIRTERTMNVEGVIATVWQCVDLMR